MKSTQPKGEPQPAQVPEPPLPKAVSEMLSSCRQLLHGFSVSIDYVELRHATSEDKQRATMSNGVIDKPFPKEKLLKDDKHFKAENIVRPFADRLVRLGYVMMRIELSEMEDCDLNDTEWNIDVFVHDEHAKQKQHTAPLMMSDD